MTTLDEGDKKILMILQDNGRTPFADVATRVGMAESTVRYRVNKLLKNGTIDRFTAILNPRKIGYPVAAIIFVKVKSQRLKKAVKIMASYNEISHMMQTTGEYDVLAVVHVEDMTHLNKLAARIRGISGVEEASVSVATGLFKLDYRFRLT